MNQTQKEEIALFRFSVIGPAINKTHSYKTDSAYFRATAAAAMRNPVTGEQKCYSPRTLRYWKHRYEKHGLAGLTPGDRNDLGSFRALSREAQLRINEILEEYSRIPNTALREQLKLEGFITDSCSQSTIDRYVRAARPEKKLPGIHKGKDRKAFEFRYANECWQADTTFLRELKGRKVALMLIVDDASRMVVGYGLFFQDNAENFMSVLKHAISIYGKPKKLYMDNGAPYANKQLDLICAQLGIQVSHTPVRDGAAKGKVERLNRTLKEGWLSLTEWNDFTDLSQIEESFHQYLYPKYINKPHSALKKEDGTEVTPRERFLQDEEIIQKVSLQELDHVFVLRYQRKVRTNATVSLLKWCYEVPAEYIGETVQIYMDPLDHSRVELEDPLTKKRIPIRKVNKVENSNGVRKQSLSYRDRGEA